MSFRKNAERRGRKISIYLPDEILAEVEHEAARLERSKSWLFQQAWRASRDRISSMLAPPGDDERVRDNRRYSTYEKVRGRRTNLQLVGDE